MSFGEVYDRVLKEYPHILTVEEMSHALGISTKTGYHLLREKKDKVDTHKPAREGQQEKSGKAVNGSASGI